MAPATTMDESELIKEGHYTAFGMAGTSTQIIGCSLCMGKIPKVIKYCETWLDLASAGQSGGHHIPHWAV